MATPFGNGPAAAWNWLTGKGGSGVQRVSPPIQRRDTSTGNSLAGDPYLPPSVLDNQFDVEDVTPDAAYESLADPYGNDSQWGVDNWNIDPYGNDSEWGINNWDIPQSSSGSAGRSGGGGYVAGSYPTWSADAWDEPKKEKQQSAPAPNGMNWWNTQWRRTPTMQQGLDSWLLGNYMNKPGEMAQQATDAIGSQLNMNADRNHQRGMLNDILSAVGNIGSGGGNRMSGFQDVRTGQGAWLPGTSQSSITAGPLPASQVRGAVNTARGGGGDRTAPTAGLRIPAGAQAELNQRYDTSMTNQGNQNATALDRYAAGQNAGLKRGAEQAAAGQGLANNSWLVGANTQNIANDTRQRNALLRLAGKYGGIG